MRPCFVPFPEFAKLSKDESFWQQKIVFAFGQLTVIALAAWKCSGLGLIPTTQGDWLEFLPVTEVRV